MCVVLVFFYFIGVQIYNKDFALLTNRYNYKIGIPQYATYIAFVIAIVGIYADFKEANVFTVCVSVFLGLILSFITEKFLSIQNSQNRFYNYGVRLLEIIILDVAFYYYDLCLFTPFIVMGWYMRNNMFSAVHRKDVVLASYLKKEVKDTLTSLKTDSTIPEGIPCFAHAGNDNPYHDLKTYNVRDFGVEPNTDEDLLSRIQHLIDNVGNNGGGIIFFPKGTYMFNKSGKKEFIQINHSNIILEGELDKDGNQLSVLKNCGNLAQGEKYPWLSPFFITTGESIQQSNIFFGLQFRKRKNIVMRSSSLSDPGSDGNLLEPEFATKVIKSSAKGSDLLYVDDSSKVGKYIMIGMYNTDKEASLLKDILGQDRIRPEWQAASRAGEEEAPSYQWLIEVKKVIDEHTIQLVQPHWRDCEMKYEPAVFNVEMLENIAIRNIKITSTWNGLFRHHGHKRYYEVAQAQEMDYGWNAINMKRVAHGNISNVVIENFTNPLYVLDSRNVQCEDLVIKGYDGHQGIKIYEHACDNLFRNIVFYNHYADMMGGEGNAYGNVFSNVKYLNPCFKPVDYDFHGFSEGPMSPPSYNLFELVYNFAVIGSSGSLHMAPSCSRTNVWWNCKSEGEVKGSFLFHQKYRPALTIKNRAGIIVKTIKMIARKKVHSLTDCKKIYFDVYKKKVDLEIMSYDDIARFYTDFYLYGIQSTFDMSLINKDIINVGGDNVAMEISSLFLHQKKEIQ